MCLITQSCPTLCDPMDCCLPGSSVHADSLGRNTGVGCHALLQGILTTQGLNYVSCIGRQVLYCLSHQGWTSHGDVQLMRCDLQDSEHSGEDINSPLLAVLWAMPVASPRKVWIYVKQEGSLCLGGQASLSCEWRFVPRGLILVLIVHHSPSTPYPPLCSPSGPALQGQCLRANPL